MTDRTCPTCKIRWRIPGSVRDFNPRALSGNEVNWFVNAARTFDEMTNGERYTAEEFIQWLRPDLMRQSSKVPESEGVRVSQGGNSVGYSSADPIPFLHRKDVA